MQITILTDNQAKNDSIRCEAGLSIYVESKKHKLLVDTGHTDAFIQNAQTLGIDLSQVDVCCLTHGHYDHCNGLVHFLKINDKAKIYSSAEIFGKYYNSKNEYIGISDEIKKYKDRFVFVEDEYFVDESLHMFTGNDKISVQGMREIGYSQRSNGLMEPDDFHHEMYILIGEKQKLMLSGCTHKGVVNAMHWARFERVSAFLGGMRFGSFDKNDRRDVRHAQETIEELKKHKAKYYLCHCKNEDFYVFLAEGLGEHMQRVYAGMQFGI